MHPPHPQPVVISPTPANIPRCWEWQMQDHTGAPGTARKRIARTIVPATCGGVTAPMAPGHGRPLAASRPVDYHWSLAWHPPVPEPGRFPTAPGSAWHDRPRATPRAPGADVPSATPAGAPGQHRPSAVPSAPDHDRSSTRHKKAPGHDRPLAASSGAAGRDRPRATPKAPGADVPPATAAGAPGQHRLRAAPSVPVSDRLRPVAKGAGS